MIQYLKEDVRSRIVEAALHAFAAKGYRGATMAAIADAAKISTGNVYRYFEGKRPLFEAVVPPSLVRRFRELLAERLEAAKDADDLRALPPGHAYWAAAERLLEFTVDHRLEMVIVLGRAAGTRYEGLTAEVVEELVTAVKDHSRSITARADRSPAVAFDLEEIYRNYVASLVRILERFQQPQQIREATEIYERYHLAGLAGLLS